MPLGLPRPLPALDVIHCHQVLKRTLGETRKTFLDDYRDASTREAIWGISPRDRAWFQLLTLLGGIAGSVILIWLELAHGDAATSASETARNIVLGIGGSFIAAGFIAWGMLQLKELGMSIADWLKARNERNREMLLQAGRVEGREEGLREGYELGYTDRDEGKPKQPPASNNGVRHQC